MENIMVDRKQAKSMLKRYYLKSASWKLQLKSILASISEAQTSARSQSDWISMDSKDPYFKSTRYGANELRTLF